MKIHYSNKVKKAFIIFAALCFASLSQSCNRVSVPTTSTPAPLPSITPTEEYEELSDCVWTATGKAWKDENQDGVWNAGETPLADVKFWVDDTLNNYQKVNEFLSDTVASNVSGQVEISVWLPGCPEVEFEVYTEAPPNCELTTQERVPADINSQHSSYSFGFVCD